MVSVVCVKKEETFLHFKVECVCVCVCVCVCLVMCVGMFSSVFQTIVTPDEKRSLYVVLVCKK